MYLEWLTPALCDNAIFDAEISPRNVVAVVEYDKQLDCAGVFSRWAALHPRLAKLQKASAKIAGSAFLSPVVFIVTLHRIVSRIVEELSGACRYDPAHLPGFNHLRHVFTTKLVCRDCKRLPNGIS